MLAVYGGFPSMGVIVRLTQYTQKAFVPSCFCQRSSEIYTAKYASQQKKIAF
jgi:hypothetical protein